MRKYAERAQRPVELLCCKLGKLQVFAEDLLYDLSTTEGVEALSSSGIPSDNIQSVAAAAKSIQATSVAGIREQKEALGAERRAFCTAERKKDKWAAPHSVFSGCEEGGWLCTGSPSGVCEYSDEDDPCRDHCDYCGQPDERK